jgi:hypothetical protein
MEPLPSGVRRVLASEGVSMQPALRRDMEQRFGHDFSQVRLHAGPAATASARDVRAHAYTFGSNIVFGEGQWSPQTSAGRHLLAHELTHVLQQRGMQAGIVQRQPVDDAGVPAVSDAGTTSPSDAAVQPDAGTVPADAGTAAPVAAGTAPAMPTRVPGNDKEAIEDTAVVYPDDAALSTAIGSLPAVVQKSVGTDPAFQRKFLYRCALYLGPHPNTLDHFKDIDSFKFADRTTIFLHRRTIERLQQVQDVIGEKNMPSTDVGFALRDKVASKVPNYPGLMVHAMGYAIDFRAVANPHFKDPRLVATQALFKTGQSAFRVDTGVWARRRETVKKMGSGALAPDAKEAKDFIVAFEQEAQKDLQGSRAMAQQIAPADLATLRALRLQYKDMLAHKAKFDREVAAFVKRGGSLSVSSAELIGAILNPASERDRLLVEGGQLVLTRQDIIGKTRHILSTLIDKTDAEITRMRKFPHVGESDAKYSQTMKDLTDASAKAKQAVVTADKDIRQSKADFERHKRLLAQLDARVKADDAATKQGGPGGRPVSSRVAADRQRRLAEDTAKRDGEAEELAKSDMLRQRRALERVDVGKRRDDADAALKEGQAASGRRRWTAQVVDLQRGLSVSDFDARMVFGIGDKDAEADHSVRDPSLVQMFSKGFFNIDPAPPATPAPAPGAKPGARRPTPPSAPQGFDVHFMEEMAKHGFDQGSEWEPGGIDSMHFELAEAVDELHVPKDAVVSTAKGKP